MLSTLSVTNTLNQRIETVREEKREKSNDVSQFQETQANSLEEEKKSQNCFQSECKCETKNRLHNRFSTRTREKGEAMVNRTTDAFQCERKKVTLIHKQVILIKPHNNRTKHEPNDKQTSANAIVMNEHTKEN